MFRGRFFFEPVFCLRRGLLGLVVLSIALIDELIGALSGKKPGYVGAGEKLLESKDDEFTS